MQTKDYYKVVNSIFNDVTEFIFEFESTIKSKVQKDNIKKKFDGLKEKWIIP